MCYFQLTANLQVYQVARAMLHLAQNRIGDTFIVENQDLLTTGK